MPGSASDWIRDGGVDEVAGDHPLALGADRHRRLAGEDAGAGAKLGHADLVAERAHGRDQVERGAHGALGVVLGRGRRTPDGHHRVADELLDRPAVELDQPPAGVEVAREELARVLAVTLLGERREADQIGEQDRDELALGGGCSACDRCGSVVGQRRAALAAELHSGRVRGSARRARGGERAAAFAAELAAGLVLGATCGAMHRTSQAVDRAAALGTACACITHAPARSPTFAKPWCSYRRIAGLSGSTLRLASP